MSEKASSVVLNFKMNGQVQYAQTLKQINMVMQTASKEYTSQVAAMGKDADATKKLLAEKQKLDTQLSASAQKVAMLSKEFEEMQNDSTATAEDLQKLYNQLLSAETAHSKLEASMQRVNNGLSDESIAAREAKDELNNLAKDAKHLQAEHQRLTSSFDAQTRALGANASEAERSELALQQYTQQTDIAHKAINNLEQQLGAAKRAFGENSTEVVKLETQLNQARSELSKLENEFNNVGAGSDNASVSIGDFAKRATAVTALATAVAAVGTAAFDVAKEFDQASAKIQMSLGLTADEAKGLEDTARNMWKSGFGESLEDVTDALVRVKQNMHGLATDSNLEQITRDSIVLAQTFDADVNEVTRAANNLMKNFGIESEEAFDLLAYGAQNGLNFSNELFDNVAEYSGLFAELDFSASEYFDTLITGSQQGVYNLDYLNDVFKEFGIRIKDGSDATYDALSFLFRPDDFADFMANLEKGGAKTEEFMQLSAKVGKEYAAELVADLKKGGKSMEDAYFAIEMNMGTSNELLNGISDGSIRGVDAMQEVLGKIAALEDPMERAQMGVGLFGTKWEDLEETAMLAMRDVDGQLEGLEASMQGIIEVQEQTFGQRWTSLLRTGQDALLPLGEAILNVAEVVLPLLILAISFVSDGFANFAIETDGTFSSIQSIIETVIGFIVTYVQEKLATIQKFWAENGEQILQALENLKNGVMAVFNFLFPFLKSIVVDFIGGIKSIIEGGLNTVLGLIKFFSSLLTGDFEGMWQGVQQIFKGAVEKLWGIIQLGFMGKIFKVVKGFGDGAIKVFNNLVSASKGKFDELVSAGKSKFDSLKEKIMTPVNAARDAVKDAVDKIKGFFDFNWSLPKLKVPKFSISPKGWTVGDLLEGTIPKLGVEWYAKGGIMTRPTAFGINGNKIMAGGEAGPEAILPLNAKTLGEIGHAIAATMSGQEVNITPAPIILDGRVIGEAIFNVVSNKQYSTASLTALTKGVNL